MQTNIKTFLEKNNINYTLYTHQAVFSCEESEIHCKHVPGIAGKNLFLKEGEQYFLVILPCKKKLNMKALAPLLQVKKLSFASEEELQRMLGVTPGSVSILGLINDKEHKVQLILDKELWDAQTVNFHPNINTESLAFEQESFHTLVKILCPEYKIKEC